MKKSLQFKLFQLGKITRNYYTCDILSLNINNHLIKRQTERYIILIFIYCYLERENYKVLEF